MEAKYVRHGRLANHAVGTISLPAPRTKPIREVRPGRNERRSKGTLRQMVDKALAEVEGKEK